ncbi:unnamed protein product, partial [marine sediment metagenome]
PVFLPRLTPYQGPKAPVESESAPVFSFRMYWGNSEYEAALGVLAGFAFFIIKMVWFT